MKIFFWMVLASAGLAFVGVDAAPLRPKAVPAPTAPVRAERVHWAAPEPLPDFSNVDWWLFGSIDLGGTTYSSIDPAFEGARSGFVGGLRFLVSRSLGDFVLDGGLGWQYIAISGQNPNNTKDSIQSRVPYLDFSPRFRLGRGFQVGPEFEYWLGTDYGLNEYLASGESNNGKFLGLNFAWEWDGKRRYRLGGRWLTGLGVPSRTVHQFGVFFEMGFDVFGHSTTRPRVERPAAEQATASDFERSPARPAADSRTAEPLPLEEPQAAPQEGFTEPAPDVMSTPAPPAEEPSPTPAPEAALSEPLPAKRASVAASAAPVPTGPDRKMILSMGYNDLPFGFNDDRLPPAHEARVKRMGGYLARKRTAWKSLLVSGHTDSRGSAKMNMDLSIRRAEAVRRLLIEGGVSPARIRAIGYGETKPIDPAETPKAWARNRRVELEFRQVTDAEAVKRALEN